MRTIIYLSMTFREIIGHRRLTTLIARAIERESLPPTLLFAGPSGVGKWAVARATGRTAVLPLGPSPPHFGRSAAPVAGAMGTDGDFFRHPGGRRADYTSALARRPSDRLRANVTNVSSSYTRRSDGVNEARQ